ncbi:MAG: HIT family protein [Nitrososphaerota archaeon]|nr:HIT family protein [Nitrososphaerota archaeon]MDG6921791.1 HIT family protein [Nitrososphaerota archaeon]
MQTKIKNSKSVPPEQCVFCNIVARKLPSAIVFEDDKYIAFMDRSPFSLGHTLVCPKKHGETVWDMTEPEIGGLFALAAKISRAVLRVTESDGFRFVQNNGEAANQMVAHVHVHVIPVKMAHKWNYMDRKAVAIDELQETASVISKALGSE